MERKREHNAQNHRIHTPVLEPMPLQFCSSVNMLHHEVVTKFIYNAWLRSKIKNLMVLKPLRFPTEAASYPYVPIHNPASSCWLNIYHVCKGSFCLIHGLTMGYLVDSSSHSRVLRMQDNCPSPWYIFFILLPANHPMHCLVTLYNLNVVGKVN